jgi:hypothetical protein
MASIYFGESGDNWVADDAEIGFQLPGDTQAYAMLHVRGVASKAGVIATTAEMARTEQAGIGSVLQSTKCCQVSYSLIISILSREL